MALSYGASARLPTTATTTTANPAVFAITCPANTGVLWLSIHVRTTTARAGGAPTYNGVAMSAGNPKTNHGGTAEANHETWYMIDPPTGSSYNISVPNTGARACAYIAATGTKAVGGNSAARENGVNTPGNSTNPTATTPSLSNTCLVFGGVGNGATTWAPTARTGTQIYDWDAGADGLGAQYRSGTGALQMGWTFATSEDWIVQADAFYEVVDTNHELVANNLTAGTPETASPIVTQAHSLAANALEAGTPILPQAILSQLHVLGGDGATVGTPEMGSPVLSVFINYSLGALAITEEAIVLGSPVIGQDHVMTASVLDSGVPELATTVLAQNHLLGAAGLLVEPAIGSPLITQLHALLADGLLSGEPSLASAIFQQHHGLLVEELAFAAFSLGSPVLGAPTGKSACTDNVLRHRMIDEDFDVDSVLSY